MLKLFFAFAAGLLTTLSPCILPVLPFVTASSLNKSKLGPLALATGLLVSFVSVTLLISATGVVFGISPENLKKVSAIFLLLSGLLFVSAGLSDWFTTQLSFLSTFKISSSAEKQMGPLLGELVSGLLLGVVWAPCSGPSLGAALGLASQEGQITQAAVILAAFGLGSALPLLIFAYGARHILNRVKKNSGFISAAKKFFGLLVMIFSVMLLTGVDKAFEAYLTGLLPDRWLNFITQF